MAGVATLADLAVRLGCLERLLEAHHEAGVLPAHLAGQSCPTCAADGYFVRWPESIRWQPVTLLRTH